MASLVVVIGLLGVCAVLVVLIDSPGGSPAPTGSADRAGSPARPPATPAAAAGLRLMEAAAAACISRRPAAAAGVARCRADGPIWSALAVAGGEPPEDSTRATSTAPALSRPMTTTRLAMLRRAE